MIKIPNLRDSSTYHRNCKQTDLSPSPELSLIAGMVWGDGTIVVANGGYTINLYSTDYEMIESFKQAISKIVKDAHFYEQFLERGIRPFPDNKQYMTKGYWQIRTHSRPLYDFLRNKSDAFTIIAEYPRDFIRGFVDAEGSFYRQPNGHLQISIYNSNLELLGFVMSMLSTMGISSTLVKCKTRTAQKVAILRQDSYERYIELIGSNLRRKQKTMDSCKKVVLSHA